MIRIDSKYILNILKYKVTSNFLKRYNYATNSNATDSKFVLFLSRGDTYKTLWKAIKSDRVKGSNNPGYQHGGKLSPFSKNFVKYIDKDITEVKQTIQDLCDVVSTKNKGNITNISYWKYYQTKHNISEQEARAMAYTYNCSIAPSERKYIEMYGEIEGTSKWADRNKRWQATLNAKSDEEKELINIARSAGFRESFTEKETAILYYLRFYSIDSEAEFFKIGMSTVGIDKRFTASATFRYGLKYEVIKIVEDKPGFIYGREQAILEKYKVHRKRVTHNGFNSTECFMSNIVDLNDLDNIEIQSKHTKYMRNHKAIINIDSNGDVTLE